MADSYEFDDKDIEIQANSSTKTIMTAEEIYRVLGCEAFE